MKRGNRQQATGSRRTGKTKTSLRAFSCGLLLLTLLDSCYPGVQPRLADRVPAVIRDDLDPESLRAAVRRSLEFLAKVPGDRVLAERPRRVTAQNVKESLLSFLEVTELWDRPEKMVAALRSRFELVPFMNDPAEREILVSGYYQPVIEGSLTPTGAYRFPIYRKPDNLVETFSRREIDFLGRLRGKGYEIGWVKDPVELFFLHIQGSGILRLGDGRTLPVNYAASNGRPYTGIGKILVDEGKLPPDELSAARLRRYLIEHPEEREDLFARNERYIFFRFVENGPLGSLEIPLTHGRSVAADPDYFPKGALAYLVSRRPLLDAVGNLAGWLPFSRFVLNQDAGAAIRGPGRLDLYFGSGVGAGDAAGFMNSGGRIYLLLRKKSGAE
jgi:membrane-bound lytic murein transglycosylase A